MKKISKIIVIMMILLIGTGVYAKELSEAEYEEYGLERAYVIDKYIFDLSKGFNITLKDLLIASSYSKKEDIKVIEIKKSENISGELIKEYNELLSKTELENFPGLNVKYIYDNSIGKVAGKDIDENLELKYGKTNARLLTKEEYKEFGIERAYVIGEYLFNLDNGFNASLEDLLIAATTTFTNDIKIYEIKMSENINGKLVEEYSELVSKKKLNSFPEIKVKYIYSTNVNGNEPDEILPYYDVVTLNDMEKTYTSSNIVSDTAESENGFNIEYKYYEGDSCSGDEISEVVNVGTYSVHAESQGNDRILNGETCAKLKVVPKEANDSVFTVTQSVVEYTGENVEPTFTITNGGNTLVAGTDFDFTYKDNFYAGTGKVDVVYKGNYQGENTYEFTINKLRIEVVPSDDTKVYDGTVFEKSDPSACSLKSGYHFGSGDSITGCTMSTREKVAGTHDLIIDTIEIKNGEENRNENYDIVLNTGNVEITKRATTCTMAPTSKVYDGEKLPSKVVCTNIVEGQEEGTTKTLPTVINVADSTIISFEKSDIVIKEGSTVVTTNYDISFEYNGMIPQTIIGKSGVSSNNIYVEAEYDHVAWDGEEKTPRILKIYDADLDVELVENESYTYTHHNNVNQGTGEIVITFIGNYKGQRIVTFVIE